MNAVGLWTALKSTIAILVFNANNPTLTFVWNTVNIQNIESFTPKSGINNI